MYSPGADMYSPGADMYYCRVVNVSSGMGLLSYLSEARRAEFMDENLTVEKLTALVDQFVKY